MLKLRLLSLFLLTAALGHAETPAQANKRLFDKTIDELNFRTMETVYDKSFTRGKFPLTLRTAAARRQFDGFGTNAALKQLFLNYNGIAERYKNRFGNGALTLAEFDKQLKSVLLDKNFEFFIHNLPRDERVSLIRAEQRLIQQASAQFNAAGAPADAAAAAAESQSQPEAPMSAPLTTHDADGPEPPAATPAAATAASEEAPLTSSPAEPAGPAPRHDWVDYFTLLFSLFSAALLFHLVVNVLPAMSRRINNLAPEPEPEPEPQSLASRLKPTRHSGLREDRYEDDEDEEGAPAGPYRHDDD